jgi:hypothetical protein
MLNALVFTMLAHAFADKAVDVTTEYLEALRRLDHAAMERLSEWTPDERDRAAAFRDFERVTHAKWTWRIIAVDADAVYVLETEDNDYYDLLGKRDSNRGVSRRRGPNQIVGHSLPHQCHGQARRIVDALSRMAGQQPGGADPTIVRDNRLIFDGASAVHMLPWLERWKGMHRP